MMRTPVFALAARLSWQHCFFKIAFLSQFSLPPVAWSLYYKTFYSWGVFYALKGPFRTYHPNLENI
jgi:hypothetical protein